MSERVFVDGQPFVPYRPEPLAPEVGLSRGLRLLASLEQRRSVRHFAPTAVPRQMIEIAIQAASTSPSGAHMQPWTFVAVSDPAMKRRIRLAAEEEERKSYAERMPEEWLRALRPIGTNPDKAFLEVVPWIVVAFAQAWGTDAAGERRKHYYVTESVGMACGLFLAAIHEMGLATVTHTPSPMAFLGEILGRPANERPYVLFPVGYAAADALVPDLQRKALDEVAVFFTPR